MSIFFVVDEQDDSVNREYNRTSMKIWSDGYRDDNSAKVYYKKLIDIITTEYMKLGKCYLVDYIIRNKQGVDIVTYSGLIMANGVMEGNEIYYSDDIIPFVTNRKGQPIEWWQLKKYREKIDYKALYENILCSLRNNGQNYYRMNRDEMQHKNDCAADIKLNVNEEREKILNEARQQADKILQDTQIKIDELKKDAEDESKIRVENAKAQVSEMLEHAKIQAREIVEDATKQADQIKINALENITEQEREEAKNKASLQVEDAIREYLEKDRQLFKKSMDDEFLNATTDEREASGQGEKIHNMMIEDSNAIQVQWMNELSENISKLQDIKAEFYEKMHNWQKTLYPVEITPLGRVYIDLCRILTTDKLISEEVLHKIKTEQNTELSNEQLESDKATVTTSDQTLEGLKRLHQSLTVFQKRFAKALQKLGMYVHYPEEGEQFDEVWHTMEYDEDYDSEKNYIIKRCITPAIVKKTNDSDMDDILIPAVVEIIESDT